MRRRGWSYDDDENEEDDLKQQQKLRTLIYPFPRDGATGRDLNFMTRKVFVAEQKQSELVEEEAESKDTDKSGNSAVMYANTVELVEDGAQTSLFGPKLPQQKCSVCGIVYFEHEREQHLRTSVHIFSTTDRPTKKYSIEHTNKGYLMLKDLQWHEDQGLGAQEQGSLDPIKTQLKRDKRGLGADVAKFQVTHFKSNDVSAVAPVKKKVKTEAHMSKKERLRINQKMIEKEKAIRKAVYQ